MKKLTLSNLAFQKGEILTRAQLKNVLGGNGSGSASGSGIFIPGKGSDPGHYQCPDSCGGNNPCPEPQQCTALSDPNCPNNNPKSCI